MKPQALQPSMFGSDADQHPDQRAAQNGQNVISGQIVRITYADEDAGFVVGTVKDPSGVSETRFVAKELSGLEEGNFVQMSGKWVQHAKHGRQFEVSAVRSHLPRDAEGIIKYVKANVSGCGPVAAKRIVDVLGVDALSLLLDEPLLILKVFPTGKTAEKQAAVWQQWADKCSSTKSVEDMYVRLLGIEGMTMSKVRRIVGHFGKDMAQNVLISRPYALVEVPGIGFRTADQIALRMGIANDDPMRIAAGVVFALEQAMELGHSALPRTKLVARARADLELHANDKIEAAITNALVAGVLVEELGLLYKRSVATLEREVARRLVALARRPMTRSTRELSVMEQVIESAGLMEAQAQGVRMAFMNPLSVLTGRPGTGKTTTVKTFLEICDALGWKDAVMVAAPTGKAASRASEVTGRKAKTIHRMIGAKFGSRRPDPLALRYVVLDESSMADLPVLGWLLDNLDLSRTSVLFVGDVDQLPSVGHGRVLGDIIDSGVVPATWLTEIMRQGKNSLITTNAHRILDRKPLNLANEPGADFMFADVTLKADTLDDDGFPVDDPDRSTKECAEARRRLLGAITFLRNKGANPVKDIQVLCPMKRGHLGVGALNCLVQDIVNPDGTSGPMIGDGTIVRVGDRVIQTKNDYHLGVFNGDQGEVLRVDRSNREVLVRFAEDDIVVKKDQLRNIHLSWVISVHRSQGSEFPYVIMMYHTSHFVMLSRSLLYTGVTRARSLFILIGNEYAVRHTLKKGEHTEVRHTGLAQRMVAFVEESDAGLLPLQTA